jgi:spermidine/putrescine transport system substrate-binding protein/spermidine/putrescine transport system permease protein
MSVNTLDEAKIAETESALKQMNYSMWGTDDLKTSVVSGSLDYAMVYSGDFFDMLYSKYEESDSFFDVGHGYHDSICTGTAFSD